MRFICMNHYSLALALSYPAHKAIPPQKRRDCSLSVHLKLRVNIRVVLLSVTGQIPQNRLRGKTTKPIIKQTFIDLK